MAASTAFPPSSRTCAPAWEARNCGAATMPSLVTTIDRPCPGTEENCCAETTQNMEKTKADERLRRFMGLPLSTTYHPTSGCCLLCGETARRMTRAGVLLSILGHRRPIKDKKHLLRSPSSAVSVNVSEHLAICGRWKLSCRSGVEWISLGQSSKHKNVVVKPSSSRW